MTVTSALLDELRRAGTRPRAVADKRYLKSEIEHLGCTVPAMRAIVRSFVRAHRDLGRPALLRTVKELWRTKVYDARATAVLLLDAYKQTLAAEDFAVVEKLLRESKTWALVDPLSIDVAGDLVERFPRLKKDLDCWARDPDFWIRRASMLALYRPLARGEGDWDRFARYADAMLDETEFFVRKAIGWVLREASKKRPVLVYEWLAPRAERVSGVTVREAVKYLSPRQRTAILTSRR